MDVQDQTPATADSAADAPAVEDAAPKPVEEWPPREWRETTRSAGHRQAAIVAGAMLVMFAALVVLAIWASHNG
ncbi:hypothetical protein KDL01_38170 [Actinospica durhamensis]|uniref:Uncharacterized protein n=1 Tax=Actinospica durhamensis TaxID=1508375 RepID=A0A941EZ47_9ACTN|nr:hypothetical protein [Actinospica durhamensis]MBR7839152.1 hypothetical protein [Actinospica durhamensis]